MHPTLKSVIAKIDALSHENLRSNCTVDDAVVHKILGNINQFHSKYIFQLYKTQS